MGTMDRRFGVNRSAVVSEIIDGEAIMMHQETGDYFSADGTGCQIWQWIGEGRSRDEMLGLLVQRFAREAGEVEGALDSFLADLINHRLVQELGADAAPAPRPAAPLAGEAAGEYGVPVLNVYTDMRDLLLLDPIHDVEEEAGWPMPKRAVGDS